MAVIEKLTVFFSSWLFFCLDFSVCDQCQGGACRLIPKEHGRPAEMQCCHEECAGGCSGNQSNQCDVCKHVIHNKECRTVCPPGLYLVSFSFYLSPFPRKKTSAKRLSLLAPFYNDRTGLNKKGGTKLFQFCTYVSSGHVYSIRLRRSSCSSYTNGSPAYPIASSH